MAFRSREETQGLLIEEDRDIELQDYTRTTIVQPLPHPSRNWGWLPGLIQCWIITASLIYKTRKRFQTRRTVADTAHLRSLPLRYWVRPAARALGAMSIMICVLGFVCAFFFPSYARGPAHYAALRRRIHEHANQDGFANINNEQIFIASSLYDPGGELVSGAWARSVLDLISILGPANVHFSLYENDMDHQSKAALAAFKESLTCNKTIVEERLDTRGMPHVTTWDGQRRLKRVHLLAHSRNRALDPLYDLQTRFDRLLYINDVVFDPVDAANLLFKTNIDEQGSTQYLAACAVDFENPFKFYDTFATMDTEGYDMGVIFYLCLLERATPGAAERSSRRETRCL